jgi:hypothetical protein
VIKNWRNTLERLQTQMISSQHQLLHGSTPLGLADDHLVIGLANARHVELGANRLNPNITRVAREVFEREALETSYQSQRNTN